jgi:hypothetical protein
MRETPLVLLSIEPEPLAEVIGVEPALNREAGRATVLKTAQGSGLPVSGCSKVGCASSNVTGVGAALCSAVPWCPAVWRQIWRRKPRAKGQGEG